MQSTERWLPIPGYEGVYSVSDHGQVWTHLSNRLMKPIRHVRGHRMVNLRGRMFYIHRLVMRAFVGPCPDGMEVCHNDGDPANNQLSNLRYDLHVNNVNDRRKHGTHPRGVDMKRNTRFTEDDVRHIRELHAGGLTYQSIALMYGVKHKTQIRDVVKGEKVWKWVDNPALLHQSRKYLGKG